MQEQKRGMRLGCKSKRREGGREGEIRMQEQRREGEIRMQVQEERG